MIGRDPFDVEVIWEDLYNRIKDYGPKGMSIAAISGIDIALWDIVGKACNKPIHKLIGGAFRTEVDCYATGLYFTDMDRLVDEAVEEAGGYVREGFRAIKMKIGLGSIQRDFERVKAVRDAIGPSVKLMVDANHCFSVPTAIRLGRNLKNSTSNGSRSRSRLKTSTGMSRYPARSTWRWPAARTNSPAGVFATPSCARRWISCNRTFARPAASANARRSRHWLRRTASSACPTPGARRSALPQRFTFWRRSRTNRRACSRCLHCWNSKQEENPFRDHLAVQPIVQVKGTIAVPTGAGLGIDIDRSVIDRYQVA